VIPAEIDVSGSCIRGTQKKQLILLSSGSQWDFHGKKKIYHGKEEMACDYVRKNWQFMRVK
jgi:hypothetical protein